MKIGAFALSSPATWPPQTLLRNRAGGLMVLPDLVVGGVGAAVVADGTASVVGVVCGLVPDPGCRPRRRGSAGAVPSGT